MNTKTTRTILYEAFGSIMISISLICLSTNFQAQHEIINSSFELGTDSIPDNWTLDNFGSGRTTNYAAAGNYSMSVWNWYYYAEGMTVNGDPTSLSNPAINGGTPFIHKPAYIEGYYHYDTTGTFSDNDSAVVEVLLKKFNSTTQSIDSVAYGEAHLPATDLTQNFVQFEVYITDLMPGINPDSIVVTLKSSIDGFCESSLSGNCLYFYVDELNAAFPLGNKIPIFKEKADIWPNPMTDVINFSIPNQEIAKIEIINMNGQIVKSQTINNQETIQVESLKPGAYLISIEQNGKKEFHKLIK